MSYTAVASYGRYVQMSGRAGRRGIDDRGTVVLLLAEEMDQRAFLKMISGQAIILLPGRH